MDGNDLEELFLPGGLRTVCVDLLRREIWLTGTITGGTSGQIIRGLRELYRFNAESPITLFINSDGGDPNEALIVSDYIHALSERLIIRTSVIGSSYSAATLISIAGTKGERCSLPSSEFLIHSLSIDGMYGKVDDVVSATKTLKKLSDRIATHISKSTGQDIDVVQKIMKEETYFNTSEAIEFGLVDKISAL